MWLRATRSQCVRPFHDDDLVDWSCSEAAQDDWEEHVLLWTPEPRGLAGGEDDRGDSPHQLSVAVTLETTTGWLGSPSATPRAPIRSIVSMPAVTSPTIAYS